MQGSVNRFLGRVSGGEGAVAGGAMRHGLMLQVNEQLVIDFVHRLGHTTRPEIAQSLGLSAATVSRIIRRLSERGLVREGPGPGTRGRPRASIAFNSFSGSVVGIDLGSTKCHGVLADLVGTVMTEIVVPSDEAGDPFATLISMIDRLEHAAERAATPLAAMTVGVPAIVDPRTGIATRGPNVRWHGFPLGDRLAQHVRVPCAVENDVDLAALGHAWKGDAQGIPDYVVLSVGTGIGAAVVVDGRLLRGRNQAAGEVGNLVLDKALLRSSRPDGIGAFEVLASGVGIAAAAREAIARHAAGRVLGHAGPQPSTADVFAAAGTGDPTASLMVQEVRDYVAMGIIAIASVVDPALVILDGSVGRALGPYLSEMDGVLNDHLAAPPDLIISSLGSESTVIGAVAASLDISRLGLRGRSDHPSTASEDALVMIPK